MRHNKIWVPNLDGDPGLALTCQYRDAATDDLQIMRLG